MVSCLPEISTGTLSRPVFRNRGQRVVLSVEGYSESGTEGKCITGTKIWVQRLYGKEGFALPGPNSTYWGWDRSKGFLTCPAAEGWRFYHLTWQLIILLDLISFYMLLWAGNFMPQRRISNENSSWKDIVRLSNNSAAQLIVAPDVLHPTIYRKKEVY